MELVGLLKDKEDSLFEEFDQFNDSSFDIIRNEKMTKYVLDFLR